MSAKEGIPSEFCDGHNLMVEWPNIAKKGRANRKMSMVTRRAAKFLFFFENPCLLITADWAKATVVYLSPYCRLPSFAHDPQREMTQGVREGKREVQQWDRYDRPKTLFLDVGNEQAPSRRNNQLAEAPILHVAASKNNQGHGKGQD